MLTDSNFKEPGFVGVSMIQNSSFFLTFVSRELWKEGNWIARRLGVIHGRALEKKIQTDALVLLAFGGPFSVSGIHLRI